MSTQEQSTATQTLFSAAREQANELRTEVEALKLENSNLDKECGAAFDLSVAAQAVVGRNDLCDITINVLQDRITDYETARDGVKR